MVNLNKKSPDITIKINRNTILVILLVFVGLMLTYSYGRASGLKNITPSSTPTPKPSPTSINTPTPKPSVTNYQAPKPTPTPTPDPDPIVKCTISPNCGGGVKEMRKSACESSVCCEIGNTWALRTKDACTTAQNDIEHQKWSGYCEDAYIDKNTGQYLDGYAECLDRIP